MYLFFYRGKYIHISMKKISPVTHLICVDNCIVRCKFSFWMILFKTSNPFSLHTKAISIAEIFSFVFLGAFRPEKWTEMCKLEVMPSKSFIFLQLFELKDDFIQAEIRKPSHQPTCSVSNKNNYVQAFSRLFYLDTVSEVFTVPKTAHRTYLNCQFLHSFWCFQMCVIKLSIWNYISRYLLNDSWIIFY